MLLFEEETQEQLRSKFLEQRKRGIGGSDAPIIMGLSPYKNSYQLFLEKTGLVQAEDISNQFQVRIGVENEPVARALFEQETGMRFTPTRWEHPTHKHRLCNDDGYDPTFKAILEIKCMGAKNHELAKQGIVPEHYMAQCQYNLGVSDSLICYFISYQYKTKELVVVNVYPDLEYQQKIFDAVDDFWLNHVVPMNPPPITDDLYISCIDPDFELAAEKYKRLKADLKMVEEELEMVETVLHGFLGNAAGIKQNGLAISRIVRRGNVKYQDIPELKGVDLERYRAPNTTYIAIKGVKS